MTTYCEPRDNCAFDSSTWKCVFCGREAGKNWGSTLDQWEAEANADLMAYEDSVSERTLALIDLVRKKDALTREMKTQALAFDGPVASHYVETTCDCLLALTEQLK